MKTTPRLANYRNREFIKYLEDVVKIFKLADLRGLNLEPYVTKLEAAITKLNAVYSIAKKDSNTVRLEDLDARRDAAIVGIRTLAEAYSNHFDPATRNAGLLIKERIDKYGSSISNLNYLAETKAIGGILSDFENDASVKAAITLFKINSWVAELNNANNDFNDLFLLRNRGQVGQPDQNIKELRLETMPVYRLLIDKTNAFYLALDKAEYKALLDEVDGIAALYNEKIPKPDEKTENPPKA